MNEVIIIINGVRYDAVNEEDYRSCKGCDIGKNALTTTCPLYAMCKKLNIIFKKSDKMFEK